MENLEIVLHMVRSYVQHIKRHQSEEFHLFDFGHRYPELFGVDLSESQHALAWELLTGLAETILAEINTEFNRNKDD